MSEISTESSAGDVSSEKEELSHLQKVTVIEAADIPKASPEALRLLESIGKLNWF